MTTPPNTPVSSVWIEKRSLPQRAGVLRGQRAVDFQQRIDGGVHHQIGDQRGQPRRALVAFGQPHRHADREQDRQVGEHDGAGAGHHRKYALQPADVEEGISLNGIGIGQRAADPQQQTGRRQRTAIGSMNDLPNSWAFSNQPPERDNSGVDINFPLLSFL